MKADWKTIDSAPLDEEILLYVNELIGTTKGRWSLGRKFWVYHPAEMGLPYMAHHQPTHWDHLPEGPTT